MVLPLAGLAPFSPIATVTPFTTRDTDSYQTQLRGLRQIVNDLIAEVNNLAVTDAANLDNAIALLTNQLNLSLASFESYITDLVMSSHDDGIAYDPTNGSYTEGVSTVISRVYDNARIFAYFAKQYDDLELTASAYDALNYSARHFDLGVTYPTLSDELA